MALGPIGDIGATEFAAVNSVEWSTAADWDNAVSGAGVVHEAFGDLPGADVVTLGYPSFDRGGSSLYAYWPFDEDNGSTADDVGPNNYDADINGPTLGAAGIHGRTGFDYDGTDDDVNSRNDEDLSSGSFSVAAWINFDTVQDGRRVFHADYNGDGYAISVGDTGKDGVLRFFIRGKDTTSLDTSTGLLSANTLYHVVGVYDDANENRYVYVDGVEEAALTSDTGTPDSTTGNQVVGTNGSSGLPTNGLIDEPRIWRRPLSASEVQALYDAGTGGQLETATKTFSTTQTPDLTNLSYSLNAGSIDLNIIGSPGTASEEVVTQTLDGATDYSLTWSNSHTDFRLRPNLSTPNPTDTAPTFSAATLIS